MIRGQLSLWGINVLEAESGASAVAQLKASINSNILVPVVILDMCLANENIESVSRDIRECVGEDDLNLILMTSIASRGDAKRFAKMGFKAYFTKPISSEDMRSALSIVLENGEALENASPLITQHYVKSLSKNVEDDQSWPEDTRVLLVEDNAINQEVATGILHEFGLTADAVANGLEAIDALKFSLDTGSYTLVIMDCQMPELDGYEATRSIRAGKAGEAVTNIPIIAMTANAMKGDREKCIGAGMDDYITKPVEPSELLKKLQFWLLGSSGNIQAKRQEQQRVYAENTPSITESGMEEQAAPKEEWDKESALKRVRNKPERLVKLIGLFLVDIPDRIRDIHDACEKQDYERVRECAHAIKGVAGNLGADKLSAVAAAIELSVKSDEFQAMDETSQNTMTQSLDTHLELLKALLEAFVSEHDAIAEGK